MTGGPGVPAAVRTSRVQRLQRATKALAPGAIALLGMLLAWYGQISLRVTGPERLALLALAGAIALLAVASLVRLTWWRSRPVLAWLASWAGLAASAALTWRGLPVGERPALGQIRAVVSARDEVALLAAGALAGTALIVLSRGERRGVRGFRWLWLGVLATTAPVALREILTDQHIVVTRWIEWYFTPHTPAATFANPNNYGCVLVAVVGTLLAWSLDQIPRWASTALVALAAFALWLTWTTLSRGAFAAIAVQLVMVGIGLAARLDVPRRLRRSALARALTAALGTVVAAALVAAFLVPALAARNPLLRAPKAGETASDAQRLDLIRAGLRYWRSSPWVGTGPGTYEYHLTMEKPPGVADPTINAHNAFVEILSQYGVLGAVPLVALLGLLLWYAVRPGAEGVPEARTISLRVELACLLVAYAVTAVVVSSALALLLWYVMLAHAVAVAWTLDRARSADQPAAPR